MDNSITIEMIDDWAGAAMQGLMSGQGQSKDLNMQRVATLSYAMAEEMAKARGVFLEAHGDTLSDSDTDSHEY